MFLTPLLVSLLTTTLTAASPAPLSSRASNSTSTSNSTHCGCGYKDSNGNLWREAIISDFTKGALNAVNANWDVQTWSSTNENYTRQNSATNVYQYLGGLGLKTSAFKGNSSGGTIYTAEIQTQRSDIEYGTFRTTAAIPSTPGVVFGFFSYQSDTQETDIEFRTVDLNRQHSVHYSNQPAGDPNSNVTKTLPGLLTLPNFHRFDWLPTKTMFYYDTIKEAELSVNVPTDPSYVIMSVWSDGGDWSDGPPKADAIGTVYSTQLYFNSTSFSESAFNAQCASAKSAVCRI